MSDDFRDDTVYILDTNVLIGFSFWNPIQLNSDFWKRLESALIDGKWILLDVVVQEVEYWNKDLVKWCRKQKSQGLVREINEEDKYRGIEINNEYTMIDEATLKSTVDTYIIAHAEANNFGVFSRESKRRDSSELYKIPDVCEKLKIERISQPIVFLKKIDF